MRAIDQTDFETNNIEVLQFWMMNPYAPTASSATEPGGQLYFDLGSVSEDILKDGKKEFENGLRTPNIDAAIDGSSVTGGMSPANPIQVTTAFSNDASDRPFQDVGLDGIGDDDERTKFANYLASLNVNAGATAFQNAQNDPSSDNFINYRDAQYDARQTGILGRYKNVNNPQGNSPVATGGQTTITAYTLYPDQEDLNKDNTMNELEQYFEYRVQISPDSFAVGKNFITDKQVVAPANGAEQDWYQFRIPISQYYSECGGYPLDFKFRSSSSECMANGFQDSVVCRFASLRAGKEFMEKFHLQDRHHGEVPGIRY